MQEPDIIYNLSADLASPSPAGMYGCIDIIDPAGICGWLVDLKGGANSITAYLDGMPVAAGKQNLWRKDVADLIGADQTYGFQLFWLRDQLQSLLEQNKNEFDLLFSFNDISFCFSSQPTLQRQIIENIIKSLPPKPIAKSLPDLPVSNTPQGKFADTKIIAFISDKLFADSFVPQDGWLPVAKAQPLFPGHQQPRYPSRLGMYDMRLPVVREQQAALARQYGIDGFCHFLSWAETSLQMSAPLQDMLKSGIPDFPFCICRISPEKGVQPKEDEAQFIEEILPFLLDHRYINLNGAALLLVWEKLYDPLDTTSLWRKTAEKYGVNLHLCLATSQTEMVPSSQGFDSILELPGLTHLPASAEDSIAVVNYKELVRQELSRPTAPNFPAVYAGWDESPIRGSDGIICTGATPELYEIWLRGALDQVYSNLPAGERIIFVFAWNDWCNGASLEPDNYYEAGFLEATRRALTRQTDWTLLREYACKIPELSGNLKSEFVQDVDVQFKRLQLQLEWLQSLYVNSGARLPMRMLPGSPRAMQNQAPVRAGQICIDQVNASRNPVLAVVQKEQPAWCAGWAFTQGVLLRENSPTWLLLLSEDGNTPIYHGFINTRMGRPDIADTFKNHNIDTLWFSGFQQNFLLDEVERGLYRLGLLTLSETGAWLAVSNTQVEVA